MGITVPLPNCLFRVAIASSNFFSSFNLSPLRNTHLHIQCSKTRAGHLHLNRGCDKFEYSSDRSQTGPQVQVLRVSNISSVIFAPVKILAQPWSWHCIHD